jgi:dTMP kinase
MMDDLILAISIGAQDQPDQSVIRVRGLSRQSRARLLKWYNGNPFDLREDEAERAISVLQWCQEYSDIYYRPPQHRHSIIHEASESFHVDLERLKMLMLTSEDLLFPKPRARLIAFEGIDGAGKTYQMNLLKQALLERQGKVTVLSCPDYHAFFGRELAGLLSGNKLVRADQLDPKSMALWYALDRRELASRIDTETQDSFVLLNRYTLSSAVYQSVRGDVDLSDWIFQLEHTQLGIPAPDLYIVFDVSPSASQVNASRRRRKDGTEPGLDVYEQSLPLLIAARDRYRAMANQLPGIALIECMATEEKMKSPNEIHAEVISCLQQQQMLTTIQ